jgi:hypothetical protein
VLKAHSTILGILGTFGILGILKTKLSLNKACLYYQAFWHPVHTIADEDLTVYGFKKIFT